MNMNMDRKLTRIIGVVFWLAIILVVVILATSCTKTEYVDRPVPVEQETPEAPATIEQIAEQEWQALSPGEQVDLCIALDTLPPEEIIQTGVENGLTAEEAAKVAIYLIERHCIPLAEGASTY